ncbi:M48 family metallopeptidase [uncultured Megasphaera sp.]|jgi:predicted Zn-dependent protease|uniref:M48 family metallopeptidase n=1 Tax=uncultured Megasphaera sp. TaxID=165188 RepID=UPI0025D365DA|nr:M48 family metallopeptidase [uncultured Megasphaera sp.]
MFIHRTKRTLLAAAAVMGLSFCTMAETAPVQAIDIGTIGTIAQAGAYYAQLNQQLNYLDNEGRDDYMKQIKAKYGVNNDYQANAMTERVMTRLSNAIAKTDPSILKKPYNYFVNNDTSFNAFCTIGHNMSVNIGLFEPLNYNENEVAFVLAHEMGHGQKNHAISGVKKRMPLDLLATIYGSGGGAAQLGAAILDQIGSAKLVTKPMEKEADALGFQYAVAAGYNVGGGAALWQRFLDKEKDVQTSGIMELFNDHPTTVSRRDTYSADITKWSNNVVAVNKDTGMITIRKKDFYQPQDIPSMSGKERAYLIAGNLSAVYHNNAKPSSGDVHVDGNNILCVGQQQIMDLSPVQNPSEVTNTLKKLL